MLKCLVVIVLLVAASNASARPKLQHPPAQNSQQNTAQNERGTEKYPAVVKIIPTEKSKEELAREDAKDKEKTAIDRQLVSLTGDLALYTKLLFAATAALALMTVGLVVVGFRQVTDAKKAIAAAVKSSAAAEKAANAAETQTAIINSQFLTAHRPKLRIRHVEVLDPGDHIGHPGFHFDNGGEIGGSLVVVNVGGTKAKIIDSRHRIYFSRTGLPIAVPFPEPVRILLTPGQVLDTGESYRTGISDRIVMEPVPPDGELVLRRFNQEGWKIYVLGNIRYRDESGSDRFMGFCRLRGEDKRFRAIEDHDYEYED